MLAAMSEHLCDPQLAVLRHGALDVRLLPWIGYLRDEVTAS
jgi:hypothetical protein